MFTYKAFSDNYVASQIGDVDGNSDDKVKVCNSMIGSDNIVNKSKIKTVGITEGGGVSSNDLGYEMANSSNVNPTTLIKQSVLNEPRPIMASRGQNIVYKLSSANATNKPVNVERKDKFTSMQESFSNGAPELGRDVVLSDVMFGSEILKCQNAKTFRGNKKESS